MDLDELIDRVLELRTGLTSCLTVLTTSTPPPRPRPISMLHAAYSDWRVPNIVELQSIIDLGAPGCNLGRPYTDPIFGSAPDDSYWSSTTDENFPITNRCWVDFRNGNVASVVFDSGSDSAHVRVVRDGL